MLRVFITLVGQLDKLFRFQRFLFLSVGSVLWDHASAQHRAPMIAVVRPQLQRRPWTLHRSTMSCPALRVLLTTDQILRTCDCNHPGHAGAAARPKLTTISVMFAIVW